jgi:hypothetical protein
MMRGGDEEPEREREESEQQQQHLHHLLQPKLLNLSSGNRSGRGSICVCGQFKGAKAVETTAKDMTTTGAAVDVTASQQ